MDLQVDDDRTARHARWSRRKAKHVRDLNHGKSGWVAGNPRYSGGGSVGLKRPTPENVRVARAMVA